MIAVAKVILAILLASFASAENFRKSHKDAGRIVGGIKARQGQFPFTVGLWSKHGFRPYCGGSLIASKWVMTAAHCVERREPDSVIILIGDHDVRLQEIEEERVQVCKIVIHPKYGKRNLEADVALLKLCRSVKFDKYKQPIALAPPGLDLDDQKVTVAGWGTTRESGQTSPILRYVTVDAILQEECKKSYPWLKPGQICAGLLKEGGKDSCQGDSGGPLWLYDRLRKKRIQVGIVSNGAGCARKRYPGVYTRVGYYNPWLLHVMAKE